MLRLEEVYFVVSPASISESYGLSIDRNRDVWGNYDWSHRGEEWTLTPEWKSGLIENVLIPQISAAHEAVPGGGVLEIGPGAGRWTEFLIPRAPSLFLLDIASKPLDELKNRFGPCAANYIQGDGRSFPDIPDECLAFVWSYDAFVHMTPIVIRSYLQEIYRVLKPGGRAVLHYADRSRNTALKSNMSKRWFEHLAQETGMKVLWSDCSFAHDPNDMITALERTSRA